MPFISGAQMTIEEKFVENRSKDQAVSIRCAECNRSTEHRVMASLDKEVTESYPDEDYWIGWRDNYQIVKCQGCKTVSFRHVNWHSEAEMPEYGESGITERLYPKRDSNSIMPKNFDNVPIKLQRIYGEVIDCFNNECLILCAAGLRGMVEGICANNSVMDGPVTVPVKGGGTEVKRFRNLVGKISGLCEKGILTESSAERLHEHRYLGNDAVHELMRPSADELRLAIEIVEHTLEQLYEIPEKASKLKQRMAQRKK